MGCGARAIAAAAIVMASLALAGCISVSSNTPQVALVHAEGATIVFESIDGPPGPVSARLARSLDQEAASRHLVVVARGGQALYRVRGYLAAHADGGMTSVAWAFDVYDSGRRRAFRLRGEERASGAGAWAAVDDAVLRRIATASIMQITTFIASDRATPAPAAESRQPEQSTPAALAFSAPGR